MSKTPLAFSSSVSLSPSLSLPPSLSRPPLYSSSLLLSTSPLFPSPPLSSSLLLLHSLPPFFCSPPLLFSFLISPPLYLFTTPLISSFLLSSSPFLSTPLPFFPPLLLPPKMRHQFGCTFASIFRSPRKLVCVCASSGESVFSSGLWRLKWSRVTLRIFQDNTSTRQAEPKPSAISWCQGLHEHHTHTHTHTILPSLHGAFCVLAVMANTPLGPLASCSRTGGK